MSTTHHRQPTGRRQFLQMTGLIGALAAVSFLVAACGGGSHNTAGSPTADGSSSAQTRSVAFAQCVRAHGVPDFPDPQNGRFLIGGVDQNNPNFRSAVQTCQHLLPGGSASNGGGSNNTQLLAFAHCMQTHGVPQFPDPTANGGIGLPQGVNPNAPQFQRAWHQCQSKLPGNLQGQQP